MVTTTKATAQRTMPQTAKREPSGPPSPCTKVSTPKATSERVAIRSVKPRASRTEGPRSFQNGRGAAGPLYEGLPPEGHEREGRHQEREAQGKQDGGAA